MTTSILFAALFLAAVQDPEAGGAKIADIKSLTGKVTIIDAKGQTREPRMVGRRLRNGSLYDEDRIRTEADGSAEIILPDASTLTVKPGSEIQIIERQLQKPTPEGKTVGRRIRLLVGDMVTQVVPNNSVQTDVETPSGTAAVRGTTVIFGVLPNGLAVVLVVEGKIDFSGRGMTVTLGVGQSANFRVAPGTQTVSVQVLAVGGGVIVANVGAQQIQLVAGNQVNFVGGAGNQVQIVPVVGTVLILDPGGAFVPMPRPMLVAVDPVLVAALAQPFLVAPMAFPVVMAVPGGAYTFYAPAFTLYASPTLTTSLIITDLFGQSYTSTFFFPPTTTTMTTLAAEAVSYTTRHEALHALIEAGSAIFHSEWDSDSIVTYSVGANHVQAVFARDIVEPKFNHTAPATDTFASIVSGEITYARNLYVNKYFADPSFSTLDAHYLGGQFAGSSPYGHTQWANDMNQWAGLMDGATTADLTDTQTLFGRILLGAMHHDFHVQKDVHYTPNFAYHDFLHTTLHADLNNLHNQLNMAGNFHSFIFAFMDKVHYRWHVEVDAYCADYNTPGPCQVSHDDLHNHLNAFHMHVHQAFPSLDTNAHPPFTPPPPPM